MPPNQEQQHDDFLRLFAVSEPALRAFVRSLVPRREDVPEVMQEVAVASEEPDASAFGSRIIAT